MDTEKVENKRENCKPAVYHRNGTSDAVYGLGLIGACIYFIGTAGTFWLGVLGFLKALVWPVFLVYAALKYLGI